MNGTKKDPDIYKKLKMHIQKWWSKIYQKRKYILIAFAGIVVIHLFLLIGFIIAIDRNKHLFRAYDRNVFLLMSLLIVVPQDLFV